MIRELVADTQRDELALISEIDGWLKLQLYAEISREMEQEITEGSTR